MTKAMRSLINPNRKPAHPDAVLREDVLPDLGISQAIFAKYLGVSYLIVSEILHEKEVLALKWPSEFLK